VAVAPPHPTSEPTPPRKGEPLGRDGPRPEHRLRADGPQRADVAVGGAGISSRTAALQLQTSASGIAIAAEPAAASSHPKATPFRPDIEGLRGIAVLLVVAYHVGLRGFEGGFIGVDVFFVLSGYLITGLIAREIQKTGSLDFKNFYARRTRRLLPASALTVIATLVLGALVFSPIEQVTFSRTARATALYASNIWFTVESADYFAADVSGNPLLHTWSLAVEEQFYVLWPLIIWLGFRRLRSRRTLATTLGVVTVASFILCIWLTQWKAPWAFFGSPARAWEFGIGGLACLYFTEPARVRARRAWALAGWAGLLLVIAASALFRHDMAFPGYAAVLPVIGTVCALVAGAQAPGDGIAPITNSRLMQYLGALSYSWYLWHWPVLVFVGVAFPQAPFWVRLMAGVGSLGLATITKYTIEDPVRYNRWLMPRPQSSLALALCLTVGTAVVATLQKRSAIPATQTQQQIKIASAADTHILQERRCQVQIGDPKLQECITGNPASAETVVLFGDSKAAQWFPALERLAKDRSWKLVTISKSACPAAMIEVYSPILRRIEGECERWRTSALERIKQLTPSLVVMGNSNGYVQGQGRIGGYATHTYAEWQGALERTFAYFSSAGIPVLLMRDSPHERVDIPVCLSRVAAHSWYPARTCITDEATAYDDQLLKAEQASVRNSSSASYADFARILCPRGQCEAVVNGVIAYRDQTHLSRAFSRTLAPELDRLIVPLLTARNADVGGTLRQTGP
jgi:peptidoglycan/LPS O-acetylase OafA/YrhL